MYNKKAIKHYEEGRVLQQKGKLSTAERAYRKVIKINQNFVEAYNNLGNVLVDRMRLKEASAVYKNIPANMPLCSGQIEATAVGRV